MAKRGAVPKTATTTEGKPPTDGETSIPRPRLHRLRVSNFRCIGSTPVEVELDDIVVLVGPNNAGKSSILRAYEVVMLHGSKEGELTIDDFPEGKCDPTKCPTIELETVVFEKTAPGEKWIRTDATTGEMFVREKWVWTGAGAPKRVGWHVEAQEWHASEGPWGAPNIAQAYRSKPHRVTAFQHPAEQAAQVIDLLKEAINERVKSLSKAKAAADGADKPSDYEALLDTIKGLRRTIATEATTAVDDVRTDLGNMISEVFPGYSVTFDARPEDDIDKALLLYKPSPLLRMGPDGGHQATIDRQGSGACRTLLWAALRILADRDAGKGADTNGRAHVLLIDEPELCLHPDAIREACRVLYDLPATKNWQVMITTHSPVFIDFSRNNTSIVRVERNTSGVVQGTTLFRPKRAKLDVDDKAELKMLNMCDPYVAEFFFGGRTILVEGDTEYTAFRYVAASDPVKYKGVHVIRGRGKACIKSLCKVLNQFEKSYAVLHDSDREKIKFKKKLGEMTNAMWTENKSILDVTADARESRKAFLVASVPNFEEAFFGRESDEEKPYTALTRLRTDPSALAKVAALMDALLDPTKSLPTGALSWTTIDDLSAAVATFDGKSPPASVPVQAVTVGGPPASTGPAVI